MEALSSGDAKQWCRAQGARLGSEGFPEAQHTTASFEIPADAGRRVALVADHLRAFSSVGKTLVWFHDWGVWPSGQRMHIFERFLASYGERRSLTETPAFLFGRQDYEDLVSFVTLGVLFLWDVYVVGAKARPLVYYSHDEVGWVA